MRLLLLGGPGAGKGTQAKIISQRLGIPHISTGDIFRENVRNSTALGKQVADILNEGRLVPDNITNDIVKDRLQKDDCKNGYILDGYPRTIEQAQFLDKYLSGIGQKLDYVINIDTSDDCIITRLSERRSCPICGRVYHLVNTPPAKEGVCDSCGGTLIQREDDREDTVRDRLDIYHRQTEPLIRYYSESGILVSVDGERRVEPILVDIYRIIGEE
jgi:adenylate kinase